MKLFNLGVLVLAERVEQHGKLGGVRLPPDERLHVVECSHRLPRHPCGDEPPRQRRERAGRGGAVGRGVDDDPPRGVELARAAEGVDDGVVRVRGGPRHGGAVVARGVEERERELGRAVEAEEDLHEEVPGQRDAAAGEELERRLGRVDGLWCARRRLASSSADRDGAKCGRASRWGWDGVSVFAATAAAVQRSRVAEARAADPPAAGAWQAAASLRERRALSVGEPYLYSFRPT